jgi:hypothetical protein
MQLKRSMTNDPNVFWLLRLLEAALLGNDLAFVLHLLVTISAVRNLNQHRL